MIIYCDGACSGNGNTNAIGGFGIIALNNNGEFCHAYAKRNENTTNNREELRAILRCLLMYGRNTETTIVYSDSAYAVNTYNNWMWGWEKRGWIKSDNKIPENLDLIQPYCDLWKKGYRIDLRKCAGHSGDKWNEEADKLAVAAKEGRGIEAVNKLYERYGVNGTDSI